MYNVHGKNEVKGGCIGYYHWSDPKPMSSEEIRAEKQRRRMYL